MGGHIRIGAVDLRLVEAAPDDRGLGVVRNDEMRRPADRLESADMRADKIGERLRPDRFRVSEVRRPHHGHKDLGGPCLSCQPVDNDGNAVSGEVHEKLLARPMGLPHRDGKSCRKSLVELAKPGIAVAAWMLSDILVPEDRKRHMLALQLAMDRRPIRFRPDAMAVARAATDVKRRLKLGVGHRLGKRPAQARRLKPLDSGPDSGFRNARLPGNLTGRQIRRKS